MDTAFFIFPMGGKQRFRPLSSRPSSAALTVVFCFVLVGSVLRTRDREMTAPYRDDDAHASVLGVQRCGASHDP